MENPSGEDVVQARFACASDGYKCCAEHHAAREEQRISLQKEGKRRPSVFIAIECTCMCHKQYESHRKDREGEYPFAQSPMKNRPRA